MLPLGQAEFGIVLLSPEPVLLSVYWLCCSGNLDKVDVVNEHAEVSLPMVKK